MAHNSENNLLLVSADGDQFIVMCDTEQHRDQLGELLASWAEEGYTLNVVEIHQLRMTYPTVN